MEWKSNDDTRKRSLVATRVKTEISETAIRLAVTAKALSETDKSLIRALSGFSARWVPVQEAISSSSQLRSHSELLLWLRIQSVNNITQIGEKRLAGFPVVQTWMHDPSKEAVFISFSPYLFLESESSNR